MKKLFQTSILFLTIILISVSCVDPVLVPINLGTEPTTSSPILQLGQSWTGNFAGLLDVSVTYDTLTDTVHGTLTNVSSRTLCWGLSEPHMKLGTQTVGELGPEKLGDLLPGQQANTNLHVFSDPKYSGYNFDGYVLHVEVYDCSGAAPFPY